jgi:hypothetical protein
VSLGSSAHHQTDHRHQVALDLAAVGEPKPRLIVDGNGYGPIEPALVEPLLVLSELVGQCPEADHAEEDQAHDQHPGDDVPAFLRGVCKQCEHRGRS